jgi:SAM-dependent methyltransferase
VEAAVRRLTAPGDKRFEQEYYAANYRDYARQNPPRKLRFYRGLVEGAAAGNPSPRILDFGCAFGAFLSALNSGWRRFGADVSQFATERAALAVPDATFARADIDTIPFPGMFDVITAFDVIEHVPSLELVASVIQSKLSSDGHFIFVVPVYDGPTGPIVRLLDKDETHLHKRSRDFWLAWTAENFALVNWWGIYRYLVPGLGYLHLPTRFWRRWTPAIAVVAQKRSE